MALLKRYILVGWLSCILGGSVKLMPSLVWSSLGTLGRRGGFREPAAETGCSGRAQVWLPSAEGSRGIQLLVTGRRSVATFAVTAPLPKQSSRLPTGLSHFSS